MKERKVITAPQLDRLLRYFDRDHMNPSVATRKIAAAMEPLFAALSDLAPLKRNDEAKAIWLEIPRGTIDDYESFEVTSSSLHDGVWDNIISNTDKGSNKSPQLEWTAVDGAIISADMEEEPNEGEFYRAEDQAVELCGILTILAEDAMEKVRNGTYNDRVNTALPYPFRTGVVKRYVVWEKEPEWKEHSLEGLTPETLTAFKDLMASGMNDEMKIGRLDSMTANDFFRACAIGYKACGYKGTELSPAKQYYLHADGRDEGLSGKGYGLNAGPGIDFDDPAAWEEWYFDTKRGGGHPWEVVRGGNSTHVDLYVAHDRNNTDWKVRAGKISKEEAVAHSRGFYYIVRGLHRAVEAVNFYTALSAAGLPVILSDAEEILAIYAPYVLDTARTSEYDVPEIGEFRQLSLDGFTPCKQGASPF